MNVGRQGVTGKGTVSRSTAMLIEMLPCRWLYAVQLLVRRQLGSRSSTPQHKQRLTL